MSAVLVRSNRDPAEILTGHDGYAVVLLTAADLAAQGQQIVRDPLPDEPDHVLIVGDKTKIRKRALAEAGKWVIRPAAAYPPAAP
jgi:hypothetical protein